MFKVYETELAGRKLSIETGKIAGLANGSVMVRYGEINGQEPEMPTDKQKEALEKIKEYKNNTVIIKYSDETKAMYREPDKEIRVNTGKPEISF